MRCGRGEWAKRFLSKVDKKEYEKKYEKEGMKYTQCQN